MDRREGMRTHSGSSAKHWASGGRSSDLAPSRSDGRTKLRTKFWKMERAFSILNRVEPCLDPCVAIASGLLAVDVLHNLAAHATNSEL